MTSLSGLTTISDTGPNMLLLEEPTLIWKHWKQEFLKDLVLGPTLYSIYVNELAEVVNDHENCTDEVHK